MRQLSRFGSNFEMPSITLVVGTALEVKILRSGLRTEEATLFSLEIPMLSLLFEDLVPSRARV